MIYDKCKQPYNKIIDELSYEGLKHALRFHYDYEQKYGGHIHSNAINNLNHMHVDQLRDLLKLVVRIDSEHFYFIIGEKRDGVEESWWFTNTFGDK